MANFSSFKWITTWATVLAAIVARINCIDIFYEWVVSLDYSFEPASFPQPVSSHFYFTRLMI